MHEVKKYKILFSGGGTGGSVAPLLAIHDELKDDSKFEFLWLGTKSGVEREMVVKENMSFQPISSGKLRRYFSWQNFIDVIKIKLAFFQSLWVILKWRPNLVMSAGSFVSVPVVWAAWFLGVPALIHQQDIRPGLANKLMAPLAKIITVTFEQSLQDYGKKAIWVGNPVRRELRITNQVLRGENFKMPIGLPVVLILGGGTGSMSINKLVEESLSELVKFCRVIHIAGKGKEIMNQELEIRNYTQYAFLDARQMAEALQIADVVVSRAGLGLLTELSYLGKPAIIIPMPESHQEENAAAFKEAGLILDQQDLTANKFTGEIKNLVENKDLQLELSEKISKVIKKGSEGAIIKIIQTLYRG